MDTRDKLRLDKILERYYNHIMAQDTQTYVFNVRFPADMQEQMQDAAKADVRSVNSLIVTAVRRYLAEVATNAKTQEPAQEA